MLVSAFGVEHHQRASAEREEEQRQGERARAARHHASLAVCLQDDRSPTGLLDQTEAPGRVRRGRFLIGIEARDLLRLFVAADE